MRRLVIAAAIGCLGGLVILLPATTAPAQTAEPAPLTAMVTASSDCTTGFCFTPMQTTIAAGGTVTWVNKSGAEHTVARCTPGNCDGAAGGTGLDPAFTAAELTMTPTGSAQYTFTQPGTYVYFCTLHGYVLMHGTITVAAAPPTTTLPTRAPPTSALVVDPLPAAAPTTPPGPTLADTGTRTGSEVALALVLIVGGLAATSFQLRRRRS